MEEVRAYAAKFSTDEGGGIGCLQRQKHHGSLKNEYFNSGEFKEILEKYEASERQGTICYFDAEDYVDIADYYLIQDRPEDAIKVIDMGQSLHADDEDLKSVRSGTLIYMHRYDEAREVLSELPQDDPNIIYQRAQLAYALDNDYVTAEELFTEWIGREEDSAKFDSKEDREDRLRDAYLHVLTSFIELKGQDYDDELVKRWVEEYYARFAPLGANEWDLVLADMIRNEGLTDMVEKVYSSLLEYDPYLNYGWTVLSASQVMNGHYQEALESADFALAIDPENIDAVLNKAHAYYALGQRDEALVLFEKYLSKVEDMSQYLPLAVCLLSADRVAEAERYIDMFEQYILMQGDQQEYYAQSNYEMSEVYIGLSNFDKALECINRAVAMYPEDSEFLLQQGTAYLFKYDIENSIHCFSLCVKYAEDKVYATVNIAMRFLLQKQDDIALQILDTADKFGSAFPYYRTIPAYRALVYFNKEDMEPFLDNLKKACEECPDVLKQLFVGNFPDTLKPQDYYKYVVDNVN